MSTPLCSIAATAVNLANAKKVAKFLIKKTLKDAEKGLLGKIDIIKLGIDAQILKFKADLLAALPDGALGNIEGVISAASKVDDLQRAINRGDITGAAAIAGQIADDFPMLGDALDNLGDIDICKELPNLIKTDAGVIKLASSVKMPIAGGVLGALKDVADKAEKFASDATEAVGGKQAEITIAKDEIALARIQRRNKLNIIESTNEEVIDAVAGAVGL
mgnify:CR=1 FL=1